MQRTRENEANVLRFIFVSKSRKEKMKLSDENKMLAGVDGDYISFVFEKKKLHAFCFQCQREFNYKIPATIDCTSCKWGNRRDENCDDCEDKSGFHQKWEHKCPVCDRKKPTKRNYERIKRRKDE